MKVYLVTMQDYEDLDCVFSSRDEAVEYAKLLKNHAVVMAYPVFDKVETAVLLSDPNLPRTFNSACVWGFPDYLLDDENLLGVGFSRDS